VRGGGLSCALVVTALLVAGPTAVAVPTSALLGAQQPVPQTQFGTELRGHGVLEGHTTRRILHFTFDDGPDAVETPKLLDVLDRYGVKATFFFSTSRFDPKQKRNAHAPAMALEVARRGHQLGVHGFDHQRMARMRAPELRYQLEQTEAMFARVFGTRTFLFRPPFGSRNQTLDQMLADAGYVTAMWNIGMADWVKREPSAIRTTFWRAIERNEQAGDRGGIVLMHDTHGWSVEAFALIAESIRARNCELLAAGEELYDVVDSLAPWVQPPSPAASAERQSALREQVAQRCRATRPSARVEKKE
jgi:peptidoglycan-N-acetylglucosamine deacetylase